MLSWATEERVLSDIKKLTASVWRMNSQQLYVCYKRLKKDQARILPGHLGSAFLEKLGVAAADPQTAVKSWPQFLRDADCLLALLQKHPDADEKQWMQALSMLETQQDKLFRTELGKAFILVLKEKLGKELPAEGDGLNMHVPEKNELESIMLWLMEDGTKPQKAVQARRQRFHAKFPNGAAVAVSACVSLCLLSVWLYGQVERNQSFHNVQKLKAAAVTQQAVLAEKDGDASGQTSAQKSGKIDSAAVKKENIQADTENTSQTAKKQQTKASRAKRPKILPQYQKIAKEYPGMFGWLQIPGTAIDLPVMQPFKEKDYYLDHDFTGASTAEGALFTDPQNSRWPQDGNTVIYGHNMKNGHVFGSLDLYEDADYFQAHQEIHFDTIYETGVYEAVAILKTRILNENETGFRYYQFFGYNNKEEFQACAEFVQENQLFDTGSSLQYGDQILMLSTCEYSQENGRLVIVARKVGKG